MPSFLVLLVLAASAGPVHKRAAVPGHPNSCHESPTEDLLPQVVGPVTGARPAWLVSGSATWTNGRGIKTLWVFARTSERVRITGRRLDGPGTLMFRRGDDPPAKTLAIANPARESVIPGGAPPGVMRDYAFLPSTVFYPTPGCWEFTVRIGARTVRLVRDLKPTAGSAHPASTHPQHRPPSAPGTFSTSTCSTCSTDTGNRQKSNRSMFAAVNTNGAPRIT
jgi:hypothetical protein